MQTQTNPDRQASQAMMRVFGASGLAFMLMLGVAVTVRPAAVEAGPKMTLALQSR